MKKENRIKYKGFGSLSKERRWEISSMGGKAAHKLGVAHTWTREEAIEAGKKGGKISRKRYKLVNVEIESNNSAKKD